MKGSKPTLSFIAVGVASLGRASLALDTPCGPCLMLSDLCVHMYAQLEILECGGARVVVVSPKVRVPSSGDSFFFSLSDSTSLPPPCHGLGYPGRTGRVIGSSSLKDPLVFFPGHRSAVGGRKRS